jgi:hypothetical protein
VVPTARVVIVDPVGVGAGEPAPPPSMPVVVTPAPASREEPTGADV